MASSSDMFKVFYAGPHLYPGHIRSSLAKTHVGRVVLKIILAAYLC